MEVVGVQPRDTAAVSQATLEHIVLIGDCNASTLEECLEMSQTKRYSFHGLLPQLSRIFGLEGEVVPDGVSIEATIPVPNPEVDAIEIDNRTGDDKDTEREAAAVVVAAAAAAPEAATPMAACMVSTVVTPATAASAAATSAGSDGSSGTQTMYKRNNMVMNTPMVDNLAKALTFRAWMDYVVRRSKANELIDEYEQRRERCV